MPEIRECPPPTQKNVDDGPPRRQCRRSGSVNHQCKKHRRQTPLEALPEIRERPPSMKKASTVAPPGRRCQRFGSTHHQNKKTSMMGPWEAMLEIRERPPSTQKTSMVGPLGGVVRDPGAPPINAKNVNGEPPMRCCRRSGSVHQQREKH
jgi:hypothetical protein